jgi:outer membrane immunogenic protein
MLLQMCNDARKSCRKVLYKAVSHRLTLPFHIKLAAEFYEFLRLEDNMRRHIGWALASVVSLGIGGLGAASAADMAVKARPMVAPPVVVYNWTGCYIGGNVGGGWARTEQTQIAKVGGPLIIPNNDFGTSDSNNVIGGAQIGCDYQFAGNWVVGVQGMFDFGTIHSSHNVPTAFPGFPVGAFVSENRIKDVFTATGRVGYLFAPQVLGYVKGGGAWTRVDHIFNGTIPTFFLSESATGVDRQGWTVGGGLEWMFAPGWSVFGEFNYMDFGLKNIAFIAGPATVGAPDIVRTRLTMETALVGVNYKFNWAQPVVAKY